MLELCLMMFHSSNGKMSYVRSRPLGKKNGIWNKILQRKKVEVNSYLGREERALSEGERELGNKKLLERSFCSLVSSV